jgi:23S rRNA (pseudouridine1915-N3)-methyltransferase
MKVNIVCVGKIKEKFFTDAILEYQKRLSRFCSFNIIEVDEASKIENLEKKSEAEGKLLLEKCSGIIVSLDARGKMFSSPEIAEFIKNNQISGVSEISFVIGGSNGLSDAVIKASKLVLSFGNITYPHQLFRVVLSEQIYRAFSIIAGLPYHK